MKIRSLSIKNLRGIRELSCSGLGDVIIVGGRNNCGKSTFLEAVQLVNSSCNGALLVDANVARTQTVASWDDIIPVFSDCRVDCAIEVSARGDGGQSSEVTVTLQDRPNAPYTGDASKQALVGKELVTETTRSDGAERDAFRSRFLYVVAPKEPVAGDFAHDGWMTVHAGEKTPDGYYLTANARGVPLARDLARMIDAKAESEILEALKSLDDRVEGLTSNNGSIKVNMRGAGGLLPIAMMGDGMMKLVTALVAVSKCPKGGVLAIDEIDNGLHYTAYLLLMRTLIAFAAKQDVQLVVTTHNREFLERIAEDEELSCAISDSFTYLNLWSDDEGGLQITQYDYAQFAEALQTGMEIR